MNQEKNVKMVHEAYDQFKKGNIPAVLDTLSSDVEWVVPDTEGIAFSGKHTGREQVGQFFSMLAEEQEPIRFDVRELIAQGDKVVAVGRYSWRVKSTGHIYDSDFAHIFTILDGKVTRFQEYTDTAASLAAYRKAGAELSEAIVTRR